MKNAWKSYRNLCDSCENPESHQSFTSIKKSSKLVRDWAIERKMRRRMKDYINWTDKDTYETITDGGAIDFAVDFPYERRG